MKINCTHFLTLMALLGFAFVQQSCVKDTCTGTRTYTTYEPIYNTVEEIREKVGVETARELCNPGKMFLYGDYLYVNDISKGIHVIDNSNQESPTHIAFINIPGNVDIAVKDNILYADNYVDLEFFDIANPSTPVYKGRVEDVFESPTLHNTLGQIVGYEEKEVTQEYDCNEYYYEDYYFDSNINSSFPSSSTGQAGLSGGGAASAPQGVAGSLSRFANYGDYLYVIDSKSGIDIFDITDKCNPIYNSEVDVAWGIETLFPSGDNLFIGAEDGLYIYNLDNPLAPQYMSKFDHARSCDPVFVQENTAYVTLRSGNACQGFTNQLDILDVTNINEPNLLTTLSLENPHGLSLKDDMVLICEGVFGLKIFDKSDLEDISNNELSHIDSFTAYDVIVIPGTTTALVIGEDGLYQYDFSSASDPYQLSLIPASRNCTF